jgi:hypothetical protein
MINLACAKPVRDWRLGRQSRTGLAQGELYMFREN